MLGLKAEHLVTFHVWGWIFSHIRIKYVALSHFSGFDWLFNKTCSAVHPSSSPWFGKHAAKTVSANDDFYNVDEVHKKYTTFPHRGQCNVKMSLKPDVWSSTAQTDTTTETSSTDRVFMSELATSMVFTQSQFKSFIKFTTEFLMQRVMMSLARVTITLQTKWPKPDDFMTVWIRTRSLQPAVRT